MRATQTGQRTAGEAHHRAVSTLAVLPLPMQRRSQRLERSALPQSRESARQWVAEELGRSLLNGVIAFIIDLLGRRRVLIGDAGGGASARPVQRPSRRRVARDRRSSYWRGGGDVIKRVETRIGTQTSMGNRDTN
jgi:hypothetical protein